MEQCVRLQGSDKGGLGVTLTMYAGVPTPDFAEEFSSCCRTRENVSEPVGEHQQDALEAASLCSFPVSLEGVADRISEKRNSACSQRRLEA